VETQPPLTKKLGTTANYGGTFNKPAVIWITPTRGPEQKATIIIPDDVRRGTAGGLGNSHKNICMLKLKLYSVFDNNLHIFIQSGKWIESRVLKQSNKAVLDINSLTIEKSCPRYKQLFP
jgi:hypothetical protein